MNDDPEETRRPDGHAPAVTDRVALPDRYEDLGRIAAGAMGEVRRVRDRRLDSTLAMKITRWEVYRDPDLRQRFLDEARVTARLNHPGIISVHDLGELPDGRLWFTMEEVRGLTLAHVFGALHAASSRARWGEAEGFTFRRAVEALARVADAVAYAHAQGVVHRDLKPANVMVGAFGEVVVMDWGIARLHAHERPGTAAAHGEETGYGVVLGTPAYMPPEQAFGLADRVGPRSDVYALGAMLYHLLAGRPPGTPRPEGPPPLVDTPPLDETLVEVCLRAMAYDIDARPKDASQVASRLLDWLEGSLRRERALGLVQRARAMGPEAVALDTEARALRSEADAILSVARPHTPTDHKLPGWRLEDASREKHVAARRRELEAMQTARAALDLDPDLPEAHALLAEHHRRQVEAAEVRGDEDGAREHEALLRVHDRGEHARWLAGDGAVTLVTDPPGATVHLFRYEDRDRRRQEVPAGVLGTTPLVRVPLGRGSWMLRIRAPGRAEVAYPVHVRRLEHWDGVRPGDAAPTKVRLPLEGELGPDDRYVPAGWFTSGDPGAVDGLRVRRWWVDGLVVRRHPVTNAEYLAFLNALVDDGRADEARAFAPTEHHGPADGLRVLWPTGPDGRYTVDGIADTNAILWAPDSPVVLVDHPAAAAFCAWAAARSGRAWRLPHDLEWEKAARGADGRRFPWGDFIDATWCRVAQSDAAGAGRVAVGAYPLDVSPYGVNGLAGNVRDWCANDYQRVGLPAGIDIVPVALGDQDPAYRMLRGGSFFSSTDLCRAAGRFAASPGTRNTGAGFRMVASYP
jgi:serine/threonine protein kinase/formylglycine-generating enzyme required for sulfatase activity